jgi:hypothetical protein
MRPHYCLILLAALHSARAVVPPAFSTFLLENSSIRSLGHDATGNIHASGVLINGPLFAARLDPAATKIDYLVRPVVRAAIKETPWRWIAWGICTSPANTSSSDFPTNPQTTAAASGKLYPFVLKLDPSGRVVYSFILERAAEVDCRGIAIDADGSVVVTGYAYGRGFPSIGGGFSDPNRSVYSGSLIQPFIAPIDPSGSKLVSSAVGVGGYSVAIGSRGDILVSGNAAGFGIGDAPNSYPVTPGAFQTTYRVFYLLLAPVLPLLRASMPKYVTTTEQVGRAMLKVVRQGAAKKVLENVDINRV